MPTTKPTTRRDLFVVLGVVAAGVAVVAGWLWWSSRKFDQPCEHWMTEASHEARAWARDAELIAIEGSYVRPDGVAELQDSGRGWLFRFHSPARAAAVASPPEPAVPGAPAPRKRIGTACFEYSVSRGSGRARNLVQTSGQAVRCRHASGPATPARPRCTVVQVWQRAKQRGAPDPGYATIEGIVVDGAWRWRFRIAGHVELELADDC